MEPAQAEESLVAWAARFAPWTQDALRRHATSQLYALSEADKVAIQDRVRHAAGFEFDQPPTYDPIAAGHVKPTAAPPEQVILCSLGPVQHLNRLASNQRMRFATDGLTVIFGDNGTGKSGYARVAKKLCRSLSKDDLLGNVFGAAPSPPAEIVVRYAVDGDAIVEMTWTDGEAPPVPLAGMTFFDSANARLYVDRQNRISYLPAHISLLQRYGEHCTEMDATFRAEVTELQKRLRVPLPGGYAVGGTIAGVLAQLDPKQSQLPTAQALRALAMAQAEDDTELRRLEVLLANDPAVLAARHRRTQKVLADIEAQLMAVEAALSAPRAAALQAALERSQSTAAAASLAATQRFDSTPISGVGSEPWRLMYDYARQFAGANGVPAEKLADNVGDLCAMCQEPLSEAGAARIRSFNDFVADAATQAADNAIAVLNEARKALQQSQIPRKAQVEAALGEFAAFSESRKALVDEVAAYCEGALQRRGFLAAAANKDHVAAILPLQRNLAGKLSAAVAELEVEAKAFDAAAANGGARPSDRAKLSELQDRRRLADGLDAVLARLDDLIHVRRLEQCRKAVETGPISRQITALRRSLVMKKLTQAIEDEIASLDLTHIPFQISDNSTEGQSVFAVGLKSQSTIANNKVLSEGEQRALALACFLAEAKASGGMHGLIIDDPVSSLDHGRIRRVATRLVDEAVAGRQIIVFTHNILLYNELVDAASRSQLPLLRNFISKTVSEGFGLVSETDEPWLLQSVAKRVEILRQKLKTYNNTNDFTSDEWRATVVDFYTALRETWERLVEEVLLGKVIERFNSDVKTQSLKGVTVTDEDYATIFHAMTRASERSGHDMAAGRAIALPKPADMKEDLDNLDTYRIKAQKRMTETAKTRKDFEKPRRPTVT
jgi:energy-coupling factor transporter ATP-binding protein EcfA2